MQGGYTPILVLLWHIPATLRMSRSSSVFPVAMSTFMAASPFALERVFSSFGPVGIVIAWSSEASIRTPDGVSYIRNLRKRCPSPTLRGLS